MGVTGLWKLIEPSGKAVPLETLENKVLAIDISIWLHQVIKGFQDNKGNVLAQAHLLGLFHRLCKLLYYRIKPIFVFDGSVPQLKRDTIAKRQQNRNKMLSEADRLQDLLLQTLAKERVVQQALGSTATDLLRSPQKKSKISEKPEKDDMFKLPELPTVIEENINSSQTSIDSPCDSSDSSFEEKNLRHAYNNQLQSIDVKSKYFLSLPPDIRHEILVDIKETRKQSSWGRLHELPAQLPEFSTFQMKRLLKRRQVQVSLQEAEKEMGGKSLTFNELQNFLSEEGVVPMAASSANDRISSDENTRFLLIRDLKKAMEKAEKDELARKIELEKQELKNQENDEVENDFEDDLQLAIQMSLENDAVYKDADYDCDKVKLNRQQRLLLKDSAKTLAKSYLIEYGGMNEDDIADLLDHTQCTQDISFKYNNLTPLKAKSSNTNEIESLKTQEIIDISEEPKPEDKLTQNVASIQPASCSKNLNVIETGEIGIMSDDSSSDFETIPNDIFSKTPTPKKPEIIDTSEEQMPEDKVKENMASIQLASCSKNLNVAPIEEVGIMSDDSNSDFETVPNEIFPKVPTPRKSEIPSTSGGTESKNIEITIDLTKDLKDDMFAEVFSQPISVSTDGEPTDSEPKKEKNLNIMEFEEEKILIEETQVSAKDETENIEQKSLASEFEGKIIQNNKRSNSESPIKFFKVNDQNKSFQTKSNIKAILDNLKDEVAEVTKLTLDDIKVNTSVLEIQDSDEENLADSRPNLNKLKESKSEVIEIDDDEGFVPIQITPTKRNITNYLEGYKNTNKSGEKEVEVVGKVKSPFFVNKSPRSSEKKKLSDDQRPKVAKSLFNTIEPEVINPLDVAVEILRENKTADELKDIASGLATETRNLELERNRQDRMAVGITEKMNLECMELLKLFGIPYVCAPMEAEAQCAFLNAINYTDGTITDDSDIWLFGGQTVYKNFFNQQKHVLEFRMESIEKNFSIDRHKLIQLAFLVGSDYTTGINGIGAVTALEILAAFPSTPIKPDEVTETMSILSSLRKFREWYNSGRNIGPGGKTVLKNKLKNIEISEGFPNFSVVDAYLNPKVDKNDEAFSWGTPDVPTIIEFTKAKFGWTRLKTDEILNPVLKRLNEKQFQASIKNYFKVTASVSKKELQLSKRVQKAIHKISNGNNCEDDAEEPKPKISRAKKSKNTAELTSKNSSSDAKTVKDTKQRKPKRKELTTSKVEQGGNEEPVAKVPKKVPNIPSTSQVIPQREKDKLDMEKKKELAATLFKQTKNTKLRSKSKDEN